MTVPAALAGRWADIETHVPDYAHVHYPSASDEAPSTTSETLPAMISQLPADRRCHAIAQGAVFEQLARTASIKSALQQVPAARRSSSACQAVFSAAAQYTSPEALADRVDTLMEAGFAPDTDTVQRILLRMPPSPTARNTLSALLQHVDVDRHLSAAAPWPSSGPSASLLAWLIHVSMTDPGSDAGKNLLHAPAWHQLLTEHGPDSSACRSSVVADVYHAWHRMDVTSDDHAARRQIVAATTRWMLTQCPENTRPRIDSWPIMVRAGHGDLVVLAARQGVPVRQLAAAESAAMCIGDASLFIELAGRGIPTPDMQTFMARLAPREREAEHAGQSRILTWLLAHGARPDTPVAGTPPIVIARILGRTDIVTVLQDAGAASATATASQRSMWLQRRLDAVADLEPPPLSFEPDRHDDRFATGHAMQPMHLADGTPAYLLTGGCGASNCELAVVVQRHGLWRVVLDGSGVAARPLPTLHHDWHDIAIASSDGPCPPRTTVYQHEDQRYKVARITGGCSR